jgi:hypothetical protein
VRAVSAYAPARPDVQGGGDAPYGSVMRGLY